MQAESKITFPDLDDLIGFAEPTITDEARAQQFTAMLIVSASLGIGLIGNLLFHASPLGINIFLYVALCTLAALGLLVYLRRPIVRKHAAFAIPAAIFALLLGVRLAPPLILFNTAALLGSLMIVVHFSGTTRFLGGSWLRPLQRTIVTVYIGWIISLQAVVPDCFRWLGQTNLGSQHMANLRSALRGVLIALPVVAVFTVLLSSADMMFGDLAGQALTLFLPDSASSVFEQLVLIAAFSLIFLTACWTMLEDRADSVQEQDRRSAKPHRFRLNMIETSTVLGSVNFLFAAFVLIQARYLFGGQANITTQGYTYAEYARRGFYELLAVSCMTMILLITVESLTYRKRAEEPVFRGLVGLMVGLTFVILVAAFLRLKLYEDAYGFTRIRVMSGTFMLWLTILLGVLLVAILWHRRDLFWIGCLVTSLGFVLTLNLMNMDGFIAGRNIARFEATGKLDVYYLLSLSDDAIPTVATLIENPDLDEFRHTQLLRGLGVRLVELDHDREARGPFGYHIGKSRAWRVLDQHRATLDPYTTTLWPR